MGVLGGDIPSLDRSTVKDVLENTTNLLFLERLGPSRLVAHGPLHEFLIRLGRLASFLNSAPDRPLNTQSVKTTEDGAD